MPMEFGDIPHVVLSLSWADRAYLVLLGAGAAGLITFVTNWFQSRRDKKSRNIENVAQEFLNLLSELDGMIRELWGNSRAGLGQQRETELTFSIIIIQKYIDEHLSLMFILKKSFLKTAFSFLKKVFFKVFSKKSYSDQQEELRKIVAEIFLHSTSEPFDEDDRQASWDVVSQSSEEILKLRIRFQKFIY